jgi:hypothetical protein
VSLRNSILYINGVGSLPVQVLTQTAHIIAVQAINPSTTAPSYLQLFDAAASTGVTIGNTLPTWVVYTSTSNVSSPTNWPANGITFSSGITLSSTLTPTGTVETKVHVRLVLDG